MPVLKVLNPSMNNRFSIIVLWLCGGARQRQPGEKKSILPVLQYQWSSEAGCYLLIVDFGTNLGGRNNTFSGAMYACMYVCICVCIYACTMNIRLHVCIYVHTYICMYVCMYVCLYLY